MRFPLTGAALAGCCISAIACLLLQPPANAAQGPAPAQAQPPALAPAARAAAQKKYDNIFGAEDKSVANRGNPRDEVAFAAKLLDGYKKVPEDPALQTLILLRVQVLGSKDPAGYGVACEALQALQTLDPPNAAVYRSQL
ncbi:MAG TPA: hypothetical protein VLJ39_06020, partial [Tepidisphaeraceae bacterium]|nr:hypothetical protein [Tepidisphaeraceae bacterium]